MAGETRGVCLGRGVVIDIVFAITEAVAIQSGDESDANGGDVSVAAHLGDEAAARAQNAMCFAHHCIVTAHPVESGVGEDSVEGRIGIGQKFR